jgi:hypothetical protein
MKQLIANYTFNSTSRTITLSDFSTVRLDRLQLIVDVTTGKILYNFADSTVAAATVATNVITLSALQGGESNSDKLQIIYDAVTGDPTYDTAPVTLAGNNAQMKNDASNGDSVADGIATVHARTYNPAAGNYDRYRGNYNANTGDTGAKTSSFNGATQTNYNARGANILINMGTVTGTTPTLVAKLQGSNDGGTTWYDIPGAVTPTITSSGQTLLEVYPGVTPAANAAVSSPLPRTWRVAYTIGGTTPSFTITNVQVAYIL